MVLPSRNTKMHTSKGGKATVMKTLLFELRMFGKFPQILISSHGLVRMSVNCCIQQSQKIHKIKL